MVKKRNKYKKSEDFIAKEDMVPTRYLDFIVGAIIAFILIVAANAVANSDKVITIGPNISVVEPVRIAAIANAGTQEEVQELPKLELITIPVLPIEQDKEIIVTEQIAPVEEVKTVTEEIVPVVLPAPVVKPVEVSKPKKAIVKKKRKKVYHVCCCKVSYDGSKRFKHRL